MKRAVKYCGGCNSCYDRVAFVKNLETKLGNELGYAEIGQHYDELYVVCGCSARCADISSLDSERIVWISEPNCDPLILR